MNTRSSLILDVHGDVLAPDNIEGFVCVRQVDSIAQSQGDPVGKAAALRQHLPCADQLRRQVDALHLASIRVREVARRPAHAAADIQNPAVLRK